MSLSIMFYAKCGEKKVPIDDSICITHNLNLMADKCGLYECLWNDEDNKFPTCKSMIGQLENGLKKLKQKPDFYKKFNPKNGWGDYYGFVEVVEQILELCKEYPEAFVRRSR